MYLSRVPLNTAQRETIKALSTLTMFHGAIERSFDGERTRRLWRIDELKGKKYMLVLSGDMPDLKHFAKQFGYEGEYKTKDYNQLLNRITAGGKWRFRLTANPVIAKSHGKIMAHVTPEQQKQWLCQRAERLGFKLNEKDFQIVEVKWYDFCKGCSNRRASVHFLSVTYEGILTVVDPEIFKHTLCKGVGKEKAYGQGLLTVMRI